MDEQGGNMKITIILEGEELRDVLGEIIERMTPKRPNGGYQHVPSQETTCAANEEDDFLGDFIKEMNLKRRGRS